MPNGPVAVGKSFNIYNTATKLWEQYYVDSRGTVTHYKGAFKDDGNLYFEADQPGAGNKVRMTFQSGAEPGAPAGPYLDGRRQDVDGDV
jgi:hypothetical protein